MNCKKSHERETKYLTNLIIQPAFIDTFEALERVSNSRLINSFPNADRIKTQVLKDLVHILRIQL